MQFGVTVPNNWGIENVNDALAFGPLAEELGYDSVWVMDHLFNNGYIRERLDDKPYYHPLATLTSYLSATTSRVLLGTSVLVLPYHNPVELAKYTATLDQMSDGRVTLGVGVGAMTEEFEALGIPMSERAFAHQRVHPRHEGTVGLTRRPATTVVAGTSTTCASLLSRCSNLTFPCGLAVPVPAPCVGRPGWATAGIPLGLPRKSTPPARRRSARWRNNRGEDPASLAWSARVEVEATPGPSSDRAASRARIPGHDLEQTALSIAAYRDAGVEHLVLALNTGDVGLIQSLMESLASETIPQFR